MFKKLKFKTNSFVSIVIWILTIYINNKLKQKFLNESIELCIIIFFIAICIVVIYHKKNKLFRLFDITKIKLDKEAQMFFIIYTHIAFNTIFALFRIILFLNINSNEISINCDVVEFKYKRHK